MDSAGYCQKQRTLQVSVLIIKTIFIELEYIELHKWFINNDKQVIILKCEG